VPTGVLAVLVAAKQKGLVSRVAPLIDDLQSRIRFRVSNRVRAKVLEQAGEA
jgi:predicted nucleic acid-binding protein